MNHHKRGFTLTELLIVVIVIGILSAVVLPRYNKTLETRKTTEAEDILSAIRTEQERRCTLGKKYVTDMAKLTEIVPNATTDNYEYSLVPTSVVGEGISYRTVSARAISRGSYEYGLYMFSNSDGRICCAGPDCTKLNKDYPLCEELQQNTDLLKAATEEAYECGTRSVTPIPNPPAPRPWEERINGEFVLDKDPDDGGGSGGGDGGGDGPGAQGLDDGGSMSQQEQACTPWEEIADGPACGCGNRGKQIRTCNSTGTAWGEYGPCSYQTYNCCESAMVKEVTSSLLQSERCNAVWGCRDDNDEVCGMGSFKMVYACRDNILHTAAYDSLLCLPPAMTVPYGNCLNNPNISNCEPSTMNPSDCMTQCLAQGKRLKPIWNANGTINASQGCRGYQCVDASYAQP